MASPQNPAAEPQHLWRLPAASGCTGFLLGFIGYFNWQTSVESGQLLAGVVSYSPENLTLLHFSRRWAMVNQISAVLFQVGVDERMQSLLISGLLGAVSFVALSLLVFAFCRDMRTAFLAPCFLQLTHAAELGAAYPIWLMGETHTYGILGLAYALLVTACLGNGFWKTGLFLLGAAVGVHPSLGVWLWVVVALGLALDFRESVTRVKPCWPWFLAGFAVTLGSNAWQYLATPTMPAIDSATTAQYLDAFVRHWDSHRQPVAPSSPGVIAGACSLGICALWLTRFKNDLPRPALVALRVFAASATLGLLFAAMSHLPPDRLPTALLVLMPNRLINLNGISLCALLIGIAWCYPARVGVQAVTALFLAVMSVGFSVISLALLDTSSAWVQRNADALNGLSAVILPARSVAAFAIVLAIAVGVSVRKSRSTAAAPRRQKSTRREQNPKVAETAATSSAPVTLNRIILFLRWGALALCPIVLIILTAGEADRRSGLFRDRTNDPLLARVAQDGGLLLTAGDLHHIQLYTRRPVLLDGGGLDNLPYALATGPAMQHILQTVYGVDLFNPPPEAYGTGIIPRNFTRPVWEARTREQWQAISREFGISEVLSFADWRLQLPEVIRNRELVYYQIPQ